MIEQHYDLEEYVNTTEFDTKCSKIACGLVSSSESGESDDYSIWSSSDSVSTAATIESDPFEVSRIEAHTYYAGVRAKGHGPKLIFRTSDDKFEGPSGPEAYTRLMKIVDVPDDHEFGQNGMWDTVRDKVVELLNQRNIKVTSVDFVRFTWLIKEPDQEIKEEEEEEEVDYDSIPPIQPVEDGIRHYTNPTIWIGVLPETLTGARAHESSKDICAYLDSLQVQNTDIAYRESVSKSLTAHGPALYAPVEDDDTLKDVIDNVSVPLSLPIASRRTTMQGTLGPYFRVGDKLYAITVRHNVFSPDGDNEEYRYNESAPRKEVLVMGAPAFMNYLASIQAQIGMHVNSVEYLERKINTFRTRVQNGINNQESQIKLDENVAELAKTRTKINDLKKFFVNIKKKWSKPEDRVIGFVAWAPPIGVSVAPHRYTRDLCVIELYKDKFINMIGNVLSLGPESPPSKLKSLVYDRINAPSLFEYPDNGLLTLRGILTADQVNNPHNLNLQGEHVRRVFKRGFATKTTVGTLTRFWSYVRKYFTTGNMESLELPILSHEKESGTFSRGGDSGSLVVSPLGQFVGLLTSGTNKGTDGSDITFTTLFEWVWELVCEEFPGANLYFEDLGAFFSDVA